MFNRLRNWIAMHKVNDSTPIAREDMPAIKARMCSLAEEIARENFGVRLDYSPSSILRVEEILGAIHTDLKKSGDTKGINGIALEFGAYIVAVIEKHYGPAKWERDHAQFGRDSFPLYWQGSTLFPYGWCQKRLLDGPGDNVHTKFQELVLKRAGK
jgi:hypothetical protein